MRKYRIVHDIDGRLRIRYGQDIFSKNQAINIKNDLAKWSMVEHVEVNDVTGSILFVYDALQKNELLKAIDQLDVLSYDDGVEQLGHVTELEKMDQQFKKDLIQCVSGHYLRRYLLPAPISHALTFYHSLAYIKKALSSLLRLNVNVDVLDGTSIAVSMMQNNFKTAGNIMLLLRISSLLEDYTRAKTKLELGQSLSLRFDKVWIEKDDTEIEIPMSDLRAGDVVIIQMGSMIPVDGQIVKGEAMVNEASFTGEPLSRHVSEHQSVFAGTLVEEGKIFIQVRKLQSESRIANIVKMIDTNEALKASVQAKAEHLADAIVPFSFFGFFGLLAFTRNVTKATSVLMVDYSCAIRLSTSISMISAMKEASVHQILVKGGKYLESFKDADVIVFDKTGTLTHALPQVREVVSVSDYSRDEVLRIAACLEEHFPHSVANAIVKQAEIENLTHEEQHAKVEYIIAHGIATTLQGKHTIIGSDHFIFEDEQVVRTPKIDQTIKDLQSCGASTLIYLAIDRTLIGIISIDDPLKDEAKEVVAKLKATGIKQVVMLTGDNEYAARMIANELGVDDYRFALLPEQKAEYIRGLKEQGHTVIMVGDGINDTPALSVADVSVSLQDSSDLARELADITLVSSSLEELVVLRNLSKQVFDRIHTNYRQIISFNTGLIILGAMGILTPNMSSLLHNGSTLAIATLSTRRYL